MPQTILFADAHPDDECFCGAGTAARYHEAGIHVALVMATRGERGTAGTPPLCSIDDLPHVREAELREAARIAGFDALHVLDFKDQQLASANGDAVRGALVSLVRRYQPIVVVTFDPEGMNRHPDHVAISRYTSDAIAAASDSRWYPDAGPPHRVERLVWTAPIPPWETTGVELRDRPGVDFIIDTRRWWQQRRDALAAHRTQREGIDRLFLKRGDVEELLAVELFRQAFGPPLATRPCDDLFAGLVR
jgi:N-acetylglucosamine malate deacetylase 2